jgi:hypothetical protein
MVGDRTNCMSTSLETVSRATLSNLLPQRVTIVGTRLVGQTLSTINRFPNSPTSYQYQWVRTGTDVASRVVNIPYATSPTYTMTIADGGSMVGCTVTPITNSTNGTAATSLFAAIPFYGYVASVMNYGAVADGYTNQTDNTAAFQAAISAVDQQGGGTVYVPAGAYAFTGSASGLTSIPINTTNQISLAGAGQSSTVLLQFGPNKLANPQRDGCVVQDLTLDCQSSGAAAQFCFATPNSNNTLQRFNALGSFQHFTLYWAGGSGSASGANPSYATGNQCLDGYVVDNVTDDGFSWSFQGVGSTIDTITEIGSRLAIYFCTGTSSNPHKISNYRFYANSDYYTNIGGSGTGASSGLKCIHGQYINNANGSGYITVENFISDGPIGSVSGAYEAQGIIYSDMVIIPPNASAPIYNPWIATGLWTAFPATAAISANNYPYSGVARAALPSLQDGVFAINDTIGMQIIRPQLGTGRVRFTSGTIAAGGVSSITGLVIDGQTANASFGGITLLQNASYAATIDVTIQGNVTYSDTSLTTNPVQTFVNPGGVPLSITLGGGTDGPGTFANGANGFYNGNNTTFNFLGYPVGYSANTPLFTSDNPPDQAGAVPGGAAIAYTPYTFAVVQAATFTATAVAVYGTQPSGQSLSGMTLAVSSSGVLSGNVPAGTYQLKVTATATSGGASVSSGALLLNIGQVPTISTTNLPAISQYNAGYAVQIADNGWPASTYALTTGTLPSGLVLATTGMLSGRSTDPSGTNYSFTIQATNEFGNSNTVTYTGTVQPPTPVAPTWLIDTPVDPKFAGKSYSHEYSSAGYPVPYTSLLSGTIPLGMTLTADGNGNMILAGAAQNDGEFVFSLQAINNHGTAIQSFGVNVPHASTASLTGTEANSGPIIPQNWSSTTNYALNAYVTYPSYSSTMYQCVLAGTSSAKPSANPTKWRPVASLTVGQAVTMGHGSWQHTPTYLYQWSTNNTLLPGSPMSTYTPSASTAGGALASTVWAVNTGAWSVPVATVRSVTVATPATYAPTKFVNATVSQAVLGQPYNQSATQIKVVGATSGYYLLTITPNGSTTPLTTAQINYNAPPNGTNSLQSAIEALLGTPSGSDIAVTATSATADSVTSIIYTIAFLAGGQFDSVLPAITVTFSSGGTNYLHPGSSLVEILPIMSSGGSFATDGYPTPTLSASAVPPGLTLYSNGVLSGTPSTAGVYNMTVTATPASGSAISTTKVITVEGMPVWSASNPPLVITVGTAYAGYSFAASSPAGSTVSYQIVYGQLPIGMTLSNSGLLNGTPSVGGAWTFTIAATNSAGQTPLTLTLTSLPIFSAQTPPSSVGSNLNQVIYQFAATQSPTWSLVSSNLPNGVSIDSNGNLNMTASAPVGTYAYSVEANAGSNGTAIVGPFSLTLMAAPTIIEPSPTPATYTNYTTANYSYAWSTNPSSGITWSITTNNSAGAPPGMTWTSASATLAGPPTTAGNYSLVITATNTSGASSSVSYAMVVQTYTVAAWAGSGGVNSVPDAPPGAYSGQRSVGTGAIPAPSYSFSAGSSGTNPTAPPWASIGSNGLLSGTNPGSDTNTYTFKVKATQTFPGSSTSPTSQFTPGNSVINDLQTPAFTNPSGGGTYSYASQSHTTSFPTGPGGIAYAATGNSISYGIQRVSGPNLNTIVINASSGVVSGVPAAAGTLVFTVKATNLAGSVTTSNQTIVYS